MRFRLFKMAFIAVVAWVVIVALGVAYLRVFEFPKQSSRVGRECLQKLCAGKIFQHNGSFS